ncbi:MAG: transglutaminase domain-containing protein [Candidatus Riflebacteria bacterium]|nr:transglutaminase domain-containing protein [Candidatus Riflebacteria bacterium]
MNEDYQQDHVVEGIDIDDKPGVTDKVLLLAALLISLPIYLVLLLFMDDPDLTRYYSRSPGAGQGAAASRRIPVKGLAGMQFSPQQRTPITSEDELIKELVCTFEPRSGSSPGLVYLRSATFERFTDTGMESWFGRVPDKNWPEFAFTETSSLQQSQTADINFFCNYEERLLHVPVLKNLAGPLKFCAMRDGSIALEKTIAVGDEFEIEYLPQLTLAPSDVIAEASADSPYLSTSPLMGAELLEISGRVAQDAQPGAPTVLAIADFLGSHGEYKADYVMNRGEHPVRHFLLNSMTGHCQHFASSLVLLCRMRGIPARVAGGYVTDKKRDNRFFVTSGMAHAWAEILTTGGWKIVDVQPQRGEAEPAITPGVPLPQKASLDAIKERLKQENAQRYSSQNNGSDNTDDTHESFASDEPPRMTQTKVSSGNFDQAQTPGTVVKDRARVEKHQREEAEKLFKKQTAEYGYLIKAAVKTVLALFCIIAFCWLAVKKFEQLLKWLQKIFFGAAAEEKTEQQNQEEFRQNIEKMLTMSDFVLAGSDVIRLFNSFTEIMADRGVLPRSEHETPGEYFDRICLELNFRPADGQAAARCFEAELYGGHKAGVDDTKKFLQFLQHVLTRLG